MSTLAADEPLKRNAHHDLPNLALRYGAKLYLLDSNGLPCCEVERTCLGPPLALVVAPMAHKTYDTLDRKRLSRASRLIAKQPVSLVHSSRAC